MIQENWVVKLGTWVLYAVGACAVLCACTLLLPFYALSVWTEDYKSVEKLAVKVMYRIRQKLDTFPRRVYEMWSRRHDD